jgi:biuret amidohydrolase
MELNPQTTAVIAVHCQGDIIGPEGAFAGYFFDQVNQRGVVFKIARLLDSARAAGARVAYTRIAFQPDLGDLLANSPLLKTVGQMGCLKDGTRLAEIIAPLTPSPTDHVLTNTRVGGFTQHLADLLGQHDVDTVVIAGVATNISVESTARAASDQGYRVVIAEDACSAATPEAHQASIESLSLLTETGSVDDLHWTNVHQPT